MFDEFRCTLVLPVMRGPVTMTAMPFVMAFAMSRRMHGMMASAVSLMHAVMMGMMAVMVNGTVRAMGA